MCAYSRSPWAAWLRFMKSMSMVAHGRDWFAWVCRCSSGLCSTSRPAIHILAGENVCIHVTTPTQVSSLVASSNVRRISSGVVTTGFQTTSTGASTRADSARTTSRDCSATCRSVSSPYSDWLPVTNQTMRAGVCWVCWVTDDSSALAVDVLVSVEQRVHVFAGDGHGRAELPRDVHGPGDVLTHRCGLDRSTGGGTDREHPVVLQESRGGPAARKRLDEGLPYLLTADQREGAARDLAPELVRHRCQNAGNRLPASRPRRRV